MLYMKIGLYDFMFSLFIYQNIAYIKEVDKSPKMCLQISRKFYSLLLWSIGVVVLCVRSLEMAIFERLHMLTLSLLIFIYLSAVVPQFIMVYVNVP